MSFGPASPDAGVELLRQLFLQCSHKEQVFRFLPKESEKNTFAANHEKKTRSPMLFNLDLGYSKFVEREMVMTMQRKFLSTAGQKTWVSST